MTPLPTTLRVLVIDDEPFQLKLLHRQFSNLGIVSVLTCSDPLLALRWVRDEPARFDVISCDLQMPGMDGVEFVRHLGDGGYRGGVLLISGEDERILQTAGQLARAYALRVLAALHKPVNPDQLRQALEGAVQSPAGAAAPERRPVRQYTAAEVGQGIERGELVNHYQPQVELATGRVCGVEALVRWQHPDDGLVYPDAFVGLAEQSGLIDSLTRLVLAGLDGALTQARRWRDAGHALQVSVNVSMENLTDHGFPDFVANAVHERGVPASSLVLEVTESRLMKDRLATLGILARLRLKRIGLSIDDFGTGHSSLSQLRDIPFDELKVDRSFVHGAARQDKLQAILHASLAMARQLGIRSVAEGVEDAEDWHFLRLSGCDIAQGYFIAKPMPAAALDAWLPEWQARRGALLG